MLVLWMLQPLQQWLEVSTIKSTISTIIMFLGCFSIRQLQSFGVCPSWSQKSSAIWRLWLPCGTWTLFLFHIISSNSTAKNLSDLRPHSAEPGWCLALYADSSAFLENCAIFLQVFEVPRFGNWSLCFLCKRKRVHLWYSGPYKKSREKHDSTYGSKFFFLFSKRTIWLRRKEEIQKFLCMSMTDSTTWWFHNCCIFITGRQAVLSRQSSHAA